MRPASYCASPGCGWSAVTDGGALRAAQWREACPGAILPDEVAAALPFVFGCSDFVTESCVRDPALLPQLAADELLRPRADGEVEGECSRLVAAGLDEAAFMAALRRLRRRELVRIAWRDLAGLAPLGGTLAELTAFADAAIRAAHAQAVAGLAARYGTPRSESGEAQRLVVLGMGKLGGGELNFSSDIDLVFLYPEHGETDGRRPVACEEYFTRLGQALIRLLDAPTVEGFVFRVDMRLRPFGDSGPLVASFGAFEDYLQQHGRDWERYAYVKARAITGEDLYRDLYAAVVRPFVYRRYLDFGVFESLRDMKALIEREVARRELAGHVKLGPGGIREIEFAVQSFQLIRGGNDRRLQSQSLLTVLPLLAGAKLLSGQAVEELRAAYEFLRRTENRLQMRADAQTHELPQDPAGQAWLAAAMGFEAWPAFAAALAVQREAVVRHFRGVVFGPSPAAPAADLAPLWQPEPDAARIAEDVARLGLDAAEGAAALLLELRQTGYFRRLDEYGRKRLALLLPRLLRALAARLQGEAALAALRRMLAVIESIGLRTAYLALLNENHAALERFVEVCRHGDFLTRQLQALPVLLDELIDARIFDELPDRAQFAHELAVRLEHAGGDPERQVEALRQFQRAAQFRVATLDFAGRLPLMHVSDRLTDIAELILGRVMSMAWGQLVELHGEPRCGTPGASRAVAIAAIGYGKLGGMELGYGSDLDLVFLHDSAGALQETAGPKVVDNQVFFLRLGQRIVHILTVHGTAGRMYAVDTRLRPSGKGGLMVTQVRAFEEYQRQEAWTWEHQALLHSRAVAGDPALQAEFARIRLEVLRNHVRRDSLRDEVRNMRARMRRELSRSQDGQFDLKQDPGGIADIEFLTQYWALRWARDYPPIVEFSDTIRQLESLGSAALVDHAVVDLLRDTYRAYRNQAHHLSLEERSPVVDAAPWSATRARIVAVWERTMVAGEEPHAV
jgi:[glutamine synthetase] adenylyltransferase / [glutamine synthetase]-adenylyl-L-tyrosine phosphorylase